MRKERLKLLRDRLAESGIEEINLSTYDTCVAHFMTTIPEFAELGFKHSSKTSYWIEFGQHSNLNAVAHFFEIPSFDAGLFTLKSSFPLQVRRQCHDDDGFLVCWVRTSAIIAQLDRIMEGERHECV